MLKFIARLIGLFLLAGAMIAVIVDGATSIGGSHLTFLPFGSLWIAAGANSLAATREFLLGIQPWLWDPVVSWILKLPAFLVLGLLGFLFLWAGRKRRNPYEALEAR